jgi:hypothetical protein
MFDFSGEEIGKLMHIFLVGCVTREINLKRKTHQPSHCDNRVSLVLLEN